MYWPVETSHTFTKSKSTACSTFLSIRFKGFVVFEQRLSEFTALMSNSHHITYIYGCESPAAETTAIADTLA